MSDPAKLFSGSYEKSFLSDKFNPIMGAMLGFGCMCFLNWGTRRPLLSGIQKHALAAGSGALIAKYVDNYRNKYLAERDAVFRHYIELHREDFPAIERVKYGDILQEWIPIR